VIEGAFRELSSNESRRLSPKPIAFERRAQ
jgi:hypothetical protein